MDDELFSIDDVVRSSFNGLKIFIRQLEKKEEILEYVLEISDNNYPLEFDWMIKAELSRSTTELINNSIKSVLNISDFGKIMRNDYEFPTKYTPEIKVKLDEYKGQYRIRVTDNGPGISTEDLPRIWDMGFSLRGSRGFGLFCIKDDIGKIDGKIEVTSVPYQETTFTLYIPKKSS